MQIAMPSLTAVRGLAGGDVIAQALQELRDSVVAGWETNHDGDGNHGTVYSPSGVLTMLGQPRVRLFQDTAQTIVTATDTYVPWMRNRGNNTDPEEYDTDNQFNTIDAVICSKPGLYLAIASIGWDAAAAGYRATSIYSDRAVATLWTARDAGDATTGPPQQVVAPVYVAPGTVDYLRVQVRQDSGVNRTVTGWFAVIKLC